MAIEDDEDTDFERGGLSGGSFGGFLPGIS